MAGWLAPFLPNQYLNSVLSMEPFLPAKLQGTPDTASPFLFFVFSLFLLLQKSLVIFVFIYLFPMIKDRENSRLAPVGVVGNMNIDCNLLVDQCPMLGFYDFLAVC